MKFGGTSVGNAQRIRNVVEIIRPQIDRKPVIVVSALGGVTDILIGIVNTAVSGNDARSILNKIVNRHYEAIGELGLDRGIIAEEVKQLTLFVERIPELKSVTAREMDEAMSFGERMSSRIVAAYMASIGIPAKAYDAYDVGMITTSNAGDADILPDTYQRINKAVSEIKVIPVITGFIGKDREGRITTLGRGGSDYTASIVGAGIGAEEIQIWTDVNGIMTADPKIVSGAKSIEKVSYSEASELAFLGAKVLHPKTILPAVEKNIPVRILNTFNPEYPGTLVMDRNNVGSRIASIAYKKHILAMNISATNMLRTRDFLKKVSDIFDAHGVAADLVTASGLSVSVTVDEGHFSDTLVKDLKKIADVDVRSNRAKVSLVGNELGFIPDIRGSMLSALKDIKIDMISPNTSEINQSIVLREEDTEIAVQKLHNKFFSE